MTLVQDVIKSKPEDAEFITLAERANDYLKGHKWCGIIKKQWFVAGWENMLVVFFFEIIPASMDADDRVWIIVGDLPSAYIDIESAANATEAIQAYTEIMDDWVQCVKKGLSTEDCYPVNVPPENKYAEMLATRLQLIRDYILGDKPIDE